MADSHHPNDADSQAHADLESHLRLALKREPRLFACCPIVNRLAHVGILAVWLAAIAGQIYLWNFLNLPQGKSIQFLVTYSMGILLTVLTLAWWVVFAPVRWKTVWTVCIPVLILIVGFVASIRRVDFTGDMRASLVFRWDQTRDEVLRNYLEKARSQRVRIASALPAVTPEDMPAYRGQNRDGIVTAPPIREDWRKNPPRELWRHPVGGGYSSFATAGNLAITLEQRADEEAVVCYDVETGAEVWEHRYQAHFQEAMGGPGPRSTPTIYDDSVYTLGARGDLHRLDLLSGKLRWHVNVLKEFGLPNATWGMAGSPLIVAGKVVVNPGCPEGAGNGLAAFAMGTGEPVWTGGGLTAFIAGSASISEAGNMASYASPMLATIHGVQMILNFDGIGLHAIDPAGGKRLWFWEFENSQANVAQPIVFEDGRVLISASYGKGAAMIQTVFHPEDSTWDVSDAWDGKNMNLRCKFSSPVAHEGNIYGLDEGIMVCLDGQTGERHWKGGRTGLRGRYGHGQLLMVNGRILVLTERGQLVLIDPSPEELRELGFVEALSGNKTWNVPAFARGKLLIRNAHEMACYDMRAEAESAVHTPPEIPATVFETVE